MTDTWIAQHAAELAAARRTDTLIENDPRHAALVETLGLAVPMWIWELRDVTPQQRAVRAKRCAQEVASHGDALMFGGKKGAAAKVFNALAEGLAAAAYAPGGVTFAGRHWCTDHGRCVRAEAGLTDEPHPDAAPEAPGVEDVAPVGEWADAL